MHAIQRLFQESTEILARAVSYARQSWASAWPPTADSLRRLRAACRAVCRVGATAWRSWPAQRRAKVCLAVAGALLAIVWLRGCPGRTRQASETPVQPTAARPATNEGLPGQSREADANEGDRPFPIPHNRSAQAGEASVCSQERAHKERVTVLRPVQPVSENRTDPWDRLVREQDALQEEVDQLVRQLTQRLPESEAARIAMLSRLCSTGALLQELARWRREPGNEYLLDDANRAELQRLTHCWQAWEHAVVSEAASESSRPRTTDNGPTDQRTNDQ